MPKGIIDRLSLILGAGVVLVEIMAILRPLPALTPVTASNFTLPAQTVSLAWPGSGQSAVGAAGYGVLAANGQQTPAPIASVAKIITALAVLKQKPLTADAPGPTITLTQADVDNYQSFVSRDGSVVPVQAGEQITERQALEAMLLPSANNMAYSLAGWAFGSLDNYTSFANKFVRELGLKSTTVADASGFSPKTVSSASDLVILAETAMANPVIADIVGETSATIPVAGEVRNTNILLGRDGIVGIKTGNTDEAGGCFMFAAKHTIYGQSIIVVGAVMNSPSLSTAMTGAQSLVESIDSGFAMASTIRGGQIVGTYSSVWGAGASAVAQTDLPLLVWRGQAVSVRAALKDVPSSTHAGSSVGSITARSGEHKVTTPVITGSAVAGPAISWRLTHP